ncbi:ATP-dependent Clp protease proteolytic subunit [Candidatus Kapabacteria bacterium]|nr:ATP-dependent Clp protease proteolytic subunit [Candidatus Kapabacteria bacterium]
MQNLVIPNVVEQTSRGERGYDIFSMLLKERIVFITTPIDDAVASVIIAQLLYLSSIDPKKDINLYINSPGGSVSAGLAIYDTIQFVKPDVATICIGTAASMAQILLTSGAKGKRFSLPHSRILMHQPMGGTQGQADDIEIYTREMLRIRDQLFGIISSHTGKTVEEVKTDADRDRYMSPTKAVEYGIIDKILENSDEKINPNGK